MPSARQRYQGAKSQDVNGFPAVDESPSSVGDDRRQTRLPVKFEGHEFALRAGDFATRQQVTAVMGGLLAECQANGAAAALIPWFCDALPSPKNRRDYPAEVLFWRLPAAVRILVGRWISTRHNRKEKVMRLRTGVRAAGCGIVVLLASVSLWNRWSLEAADPQPPLLKSGVVRFDDARVNQADWGEMRRYFTGETLGTKDVLTAVAIVQPGKAVHRAHRHAQEEYLILAEGSGTWSLDGKEFPAQRGDILYTEPWVYHGLTNTSSEPL